MMLKLYVTHCFADFSREGSLLPEVIARSGSAFLSFISDAAYSMVGFNISYSVNDCAYDCSDQGSCSGMFCYGTVFFMRQMFVSATGNDC